MLKIRVKEIQFFERPVEFRMPFRFGVVTLTHESEIFARVLVETNDQREAWGVSAEVLAPKWFDKSPELSNLDNEAQLRDSLKCASFLYTIEKTFESPFHLFISRYENQRLSCARLNLNSLIASFGQALLDRAVLDAVCRIEGISFYQAIRSNAVGMHATAALPEFDGFDFDRFLESLSGRTDIHARHTVGLLDPITAEDLAPEARLNDGLPETLDEVVDFYGNTYFKLKLCGKVEDDIQRLSAIAGVLDRSPAPYFVTLDGNEQYQDIEPFKDLWAQMNKVPQLGRLTRSIIFIEQPIKRQNALSCDVSDVSKICPVIIDESDQDLDAFPRARYCGYRGVSSKQCKGLYKSILNSARCSLWNNRSGAGQYLMSGEDLTTMAGIAVQQDLALASIIGLSHLERNGHHYVKGMSHAPRSEQQDFLTSHPDLYIEADGVTRITLKQGQMQIGSLDCPGFATTVEPDWQSMTQTHL